MARWSSPPAAGWRSGSPSCASFWLTCITPRGRSGHAKSFCFWSCTPPDHSHAEAIVSGHAGMPSHGDVLQPATSGAYNACEQNRWVIGGSERTIRNQVPAPQHPLRNPPKHPIATLAEDPHSSGSHRVQRGVPAGELGDATALCPQDCSSTAEPGVVLVHGVELDGLQQGGGGEGVLHTQAPISKGSTTSSGAVRQRFWSGRCSGFRYRWPQYIH